MSDNDYEEAIAAFISKRGVTRCPTACLAPTQAKISAADRERLQIRAAELEARRLERQSEFCRRMFGPPAEEARVL